MEFLEQRFGREQFDAFLRSYFDHFAFQSIDTTQFRDYAIANLLGKYPAVVSQEEFDAWLYEPGIPANAPQVRSQRFAVVDAARIAWPHSAELPANQRSEERREGKEGVRTCSCRWSQNHYKTPEQHNKT